MGGRPRDSFGFLLRGRRFCWRSSRLLALLAAPSADAAEGLLDPTFGAGGFTLLDEPALPDEHLGDVLVLPDGKILAGGSRGSSEGFFLARFNSNGTPDLSFGPNGIRVQPYNKNPGEPRAINRIVRMGDGRSSIAAPDLGRGRCSTRSA